MSTSATYAISLSLRSCTDRGIWDIQQEQVLQQNKNIRTVFAHCLHLPDFCRIFINRQKHKILLLDLFHGHAIEKDFLYWQWDLGDSAIAFKCNHVEKNLSTQWCGCKNVYFIILQYSSGVGTITKRWVTRIMRFLKQKLPYFPLPCNSAACLHIVCILKSYFRLHWYLQNWHCNFTFPQSWEMCAFSELGFVYLQWHCGQSKVITEKRERRCQQKNTYTAWCSDYIFFLLNNTFIISVRDV